MKELTYTEAVTRLEELTKSIEEGTLDIDVLSQKLQEARRLLKFCKEKLQNIEKEVNEILQNDEQE